MVGSTFHSGISGRTFPDRYITCSVQHLDWRSVVCRQVQHELTDGDNSAPLQSSGGTAWESSRRQCRATEYIYLYLPRLIQGGWWLVVWSYLFVSSFIRLLASVWNVLSCLVSIICFLLIVCLSICLDSSLKRISINHKDSILVMRFRRMLEFTTPPTPNAGWNRSEDQVSHCKQHPKSKSKREHRKWRYKNRQNSQ